MKPKKLSEMGREELIHLCRYYHGGDKNPYEGKDPNKSMLWSYERAWVFDTESKNTEMTEEYLGDYLRAGLADFRKDDSIPTSYKALLFNRYMKDEINKDTEPFKTFFNKYY